MTNAMTPKILIAICLLLPILVSGQARSDGGWTTLFNGRDLSGWQPLNGKAKFDVEHGELVGTTVSGEPNSFLATTATYGDFILELEFKIDPTMNSGIQFRSESKPDYQNGRVHGYQFEIDPSPRAWSGGIYDEARRDWLYPLEYNPTAKSAFKQNEWNLVRIEAIGPTMRTFLNGVPAAHLIDNLTTRGFIALQVHAIPANEVPGKQIRWRHIRIQTTGLVPTPYDQIFVVNNLPNNLSEQEKENGVTLLWDGQSNQGWRGAYKETFPAAGWEMKNGVLTVQAAAGGESQNGGDIVTTNEFGAFDLQFEFRLTDGANSGVKYFVTEKERNTGSAIGLEYQILDDEKHPDAKLGVVGNRTLGSLYDLIPSVKITRGLHRIGEWNTGRIIVYPDNRVEHWLNGYKIVEYTRGSPTYLALVARSKYAVWPNFGMADKGRILLQDHGNEVAFRSIKIKVLK